MFHIKATAHFARKATSRIGGFGASVLVNGIVSLLTIPFIIRYAGDGAWVSIAVGQTLGSLVGVFTLLGWLQNGPAEIAKSNGLLRGRLFYVSLYVRAISLVITVPAAMLGSILLQTEEVFTTFLMATSILLMNVGAPWFYVGEGSPWRLLLFDTLPRTLAIALATIVVCLSGDARAYAAIVCIGMGSGVILAAWDIGRRYSFVGKKVLSPREVWIVIGGQKHGILTAVLSSFYSSLPLLVVQWMAPYSVSSFALAEKLRQQVLTAYRPIAQVLQGWTPSVRGNGLIVRVRIAWFLSLGLGLVGGLAFVVLSPVISPVLGGGGIVMVDLQLAIPFGVLFAMSAISFTTGVACLVVLGLHRHVTISAATGTAIALGTIWVLTRNYGGVGAGWAMAVSQTAVVGYQSIVLWRHLNNYVGRSDMH